MLKCPRNHRLLFAVAALLLLSGAPRLSLATNPPPQICRWADLNPERPVPQSWARRHLPGVLAGPLEFLTGHSPFAVPGYYSPTYVSPLSFLHAASRNTRAPVLALNQIAREHGPISYTLLPDGQRLLFVSDPRLAGTILSKTDAGRGYGLLERSGLQVDAARRTLGDQNVFAESGQKWDSLRRMLLPFFKKAVVDSPAVYGHIQSAVDSRIAGLAAQVRAAQRDGRPIDLQQHVDDMLFDVTLSAMFRTNFPPERIDREIRPAFAELMQFLVFDTAFNRVGINFLETPSLTPAHARVKESFRVVDRMCEEILQAHEQRPSNPPDLVDRLLQESSMNRDQKRRVMMTLIAASYETTSSTVSWTLHSLARNPGAQQTLAGDLAAQLGNRPLGPRDSIRSLDNSIEEAMRLYTPFYIVVRRAKEDIVIERGPGNQPLFIPAGTHVVVDLFSAHRDEPTYAVAGLPASEYHPSRFDPDFLLNAGTSGVPPTTYPFGAGPHVCLGVNLAMSEARYIVSRLTQTFQMELANPSAPVRIHSGIATKPADGLPMRLRLR